MFLLIGIGKDRNKAIPVCSCCPLLVPEKTKENQVVTAITG
jgi:hypothetical protein